MNKLPHIAKGTTVPLGVRQLEYLEEKEKQALKEQRRHDFLVATYGVIGGIVSGAASSLIVLWIQGAL